MSSSKQSQPVNLSSTAGQNIRKQQQQAKQVAAANVLNNNNNNNDGTEFRDLLKGRIDIIQYLTSAGASGNNSEVQSENGGSASSSRGGSQRNSTLSLLQQPQTSISDIKPSPLLTATSNTNNNSSCNTPSPLTHSQSGNSLLAIAELPVVSAATASSVLDATTASSSSSPATSSTPNVVDQKPPSVTVTDHAHSSTSAGSTAPGSVASSSQGPSSSGSTSRSSMYQQQTQQPGVHQSRIPDSPPETTDSGAASASSPSSGSERSPYSPDFQGFNVSGNHLLPNGTVIHPPVGGGQNPLMAPSGAGVILGVDQMLSNGAVPSAGYEQLRPPRTVVQHHASADSYTSPTGVQQSPVQYGNGQPQHGSMAPAQVSPPNSGASTGSSTLTPCSPSPFLLSNGQNANTPGACGSVLDANGLYSTLTTDGLMSLGASSRKRLRSENVKHQSRISVSPRDGDESIYDMDGYGSQQAIKFSEFQPEKWHTVLDATGRELPRLGYHVVADKGFNYSAFDTAFINQKKNHFQIAVTIEASDPMAPKFLRTENGTVKPIAEFRLNFYGAKAEMPTSKVSIKQSQTDRKPVEYEPVRLEIQPSRMTKVTVARLHFSETTMNNQRKNARPNPDQKYLYLVVSLDCMTIDGDVYTVISYASEKVIVRASNPGQFDNGETDAHWQKTAGGSSIYHPGPVCIGTERPHGALTVAGDIAYTGNLYHPSDRRLKENIENYDGKDALARVSQIRYVTYEIRKEFADQWELTDEQRHRVGVIAQELEEVLPDAVLTDGEYMQVDDNRIFYESAAAVKELCRLTGNLEYKIDEVERISNKLKRLAKLKRLGSVKSVAQSTAPSELSSTVPLGSSYVSCSSLDSDAKTDDGRRPNGMRYASGKHKHHKHCHHSCHRHRGICSNKVIQSTIIALVAVMAFCLIAMATLYILDWHRRNIMGPGPIYNHRHPHDNYTGNDQPPPGPIRELVPQTVHPDWRIPKWPDGQQPPDVHPCDDANCEEYCCSPSRYTYVMADDKQRNGGDVQIVLAPHDHAHPVGANFDVDVITSRISKRDTKAVSSSKKKGKRAPTLDNNTKSSQRYVRIDLSPVHIHLPDVNAVIDERYCWGTSCDQKQNNYTFYVPISRFMPLIPLQIQFDIPDQRFIKHCPVTHIPNELCAVSETPPTDKTTKDPPGPKTVEEGQLNTFTLPVGYHTRSTYQFRLGYSTELCGKDHDADVGKSFVQYTFIFYRDCSRQ